MQQTSIAFTGWCCCCCFLWRIDRFSFFPQFFRKMKRLHFGTIVLWLLCGRYTRHDFRLLALWLGLYKWLNERTNFKEWNTKPFDSVVVVSWSVRVILYIYIYLLFSFVPWSFDAKDEKFLCRLRYFSSPTRKARLWWVRGVPKDGNDVGQIVPRQKGEVPSTFTIYWQTTQSIPGIFSSDEMICCICFQLPVKW